MKTINLKLIVPHLIAVGVFLGVAFIFSSPAISEGKSLFQHDVIEASGGVKELKKYRDDTGEEPLWSTNTFSGMPAYFINMLFSFDLPLLLNKIIGFGLPHPGRLIFTCCLSCYFMLMVFGVRSSLAIAGAVIFSLNTFNIIGIVAGHNSKIFAVMSMPLVLGGLHLSLKKQYLGVLLFALGLSLQLYSKHLQITYYLFLICMVYVVYQLYIHISEKKVKQLLRPVLVLVPALILAIGVNLGRLLPSLEYSKYSTRGPSELNKDGGGSGLDKDYVFSYSNGIMEPLVMFIPNIMGGSSQQPLDLDSHLGKALRGHGMDRVQTKQQLASVPTYWGDQPLTAPYYAGAVCVLAFFIGVMFIGRKHKTWLIFLVVTGVVLSWGKSFPTFNYFIYDFLPGYNKFRSVTFTIIIPMLCMTLLGMMGLEKLLNSSFDKKTKKKFLIGVGIPIGTALFFLVFGGFFEFEGAMDEQLSNLPAWYLDAIREDRLALMRNDAFRTLIFVGLVSLGLWLYKLGKLSLRYLSIGIVLLAAFDMIFVAKRFLTDGLFQRHNPSELVKTEPVDEVIKRDKAQGYRVLNLINPFNDGRTAAHHRSLGGYHGAKLGRYQELIEYYLSQELQSTIKLLQEGSRDFSDQQVINMLNTKYLKFGAKENNLLINTSRNGEAWFVGELHTVENADEEIAALGEINTKTQAIINTSKSSVKATKWETSDGQINLASITPKRVVYKYEKDSPGFAVFSEIFYPLGWKADIDGKHATILETNYVLRGMEVPPGNHTITFEFDPDSYRIGSVVMWFCGWVLTLCIFLVIGFELRQSLKIT